MSRCIEIVRPSTTLRSAQGEENSWWHKEKRLILSLTKG